ncbi:MAG: leucyl aminopeptidase family protein [Pseudomonadales bacterium]
MSQRALTGAAGADTSVSRLTLVAENDFPAWHGSLSTAQQQWVSASGFIGKPKQTLRLLPTDDAPPEHVAGWDGKNNLSTLGALPMSLPQGVYRPSQPQADIALLGWALGAYQFDRYKKASRAPATLWVEDAEQLQRVQQEADAVALTRDLINTPAGDMLPSHLAAAAMALAAEFSAECEVTVGEDLLRKGYRTIHAVGRAATDAPRLIDLRWGTADHPKVTLVGKGVCFDSGGLDIKPSSGMRTMKKDMGGAAQVLGLARLIMSRKLPLRLRVLVPAVENAIAGNAYRPGDIIQTYQGLSVEIDNTDAEGRLVLCDALTLAIEERPQLLFDYATLTGSARSAVGAEIAAMFCNDDELAAELYAAGVSQDDALWRMPLHTEYAAMLDSKVADTLNSAPSPYAGAVTAALFLQKFIGECTWVHFDLMAFNIRSRPGRPEGGEAMGLRSVFSYLNQNFG